MKAAKLILSKIKSGKLTNGFSVRDIQRKQWAGLTNGSNIKEGIETLIDYGYLLEFMHETTGRPSVTYQINPKVEVNRHG